jgi:hypothetical protein
MPKLLIFSLLFFCNVFAATVKIVATVGTDVITSYDLYSRIELTRLINSNFTQEPIGVQEGASLETLIQEKLLFKLAQENNFAITDEEINDTINNFAKDYPALENLAKTSIMYLSLKDQIRGEIIFRAVLQSQLKDKLEFSEDAIERFKNAYNSQNQNKINDEQAKQILTSMKVNETQVELIKSLKENNLTEIR